MLSCATKVMHVIRCSDILNYETGCLLSQSVRTNLLTDAHVHVHAHEPMCLLLCVP